MNKDLLRYFMAKKSVSAGSLSEALGIDPSTFSRKLNGHTEFVHGEIAGIARTLDLTGEQVVDIFFADEVS